CYLLILARKNSLRSGTKYGTTPGGRSTPSCSSQFFLVTTLLSPCLPSQGPRRCAAYCKGKTLVIRRTQTLSTPCRPLVCARTSLGLLPSTITSPRCLRKYLLGR